MDQAKDNVGHYKDDVTNPYTGMEHNFDEGLGYYGAARHTDTMTLAEIKSPGYSDFNGDGKIDLKSEFSFGHSQNAAKRDLGSTTGTTMTSTIFDAFVAARTIIANGEGTDGALTDAQVTPSTQKQTLSSPTGKQLRQPLFTTSTIQLLTLLPTHLSTTSPSTGLS